MMKYIVLVMFVLSNFVSATVIDFEGLGTDRLLPGTLFEGTSPRDPNESNLDETFGSRIGDTPNVSLFWGFRDDFPGQFQDHWLTFSGFAFFTPNEQVGDGGASGVVTGTPPEAIVFTADLGNQVQLNSIDFSSNGNSSMQIKVFAEVDAGPRTLIHDSGPEANDFTLDLNSINAGQTVALSFEFFEGGTLRSNSATIDNLVFSQVSSVPEPSSWLLILGAFLFLGGRFGQWK